METEVSRLDAYVERVKREGGKLPCHIDKKQPHLVRIAAAAGVNRRFLYTPEGRQRITLAVQEVGLDIKHGALHVRNERQAEENVELISRYLQWLEEHRITLPEDPMRRGRVYLNQ